MRQLPILLIPLMLVGTPHVLAEVDRTVGVVAEAPVPRGQQLPSSADLRPQLERWGLAPRRQGRRNTCSVFATTGAFEFACSMHSQRGQRLSVEYLNWACNQIIHNRTRDRGQFFRNLLQGFEAHGICLDEEMPYRSKFDPSLEPSEQAIQSAKEVRALGFKVHWINSWHRRPGLKQHHLQEIKEVLAAGYPVAAGASHSRLLVGYTDDPSQPGGGIFQVVDSAPGKFTTVTYEFVQQNVNDVFWVEAPAP